MSGLSVADFPEFFRNVNPKREDGDRVEPFPWQSRLVEHVAATGRWPELLDLPTAAGKTAVIDIAVFLLALQDPRRPTLPRRVVFVIDRRAVVNQAAKRASYLAHALQTSENGVVRHVADRLRGLAATLTDGSSPPLQWAELRGGIVRDESWAMRPDVPAVLVSTVDQVGSRLLFRGYGISSSMRPVHAGLLGNDALFILDEVHLAKPFADTVRSVATRLRTPAAAGLPDRWQVTEMSATHGVLGELGELGEPFRLSELDRDPAAAPVLARRLAARKPFRKQLVKGKAGRETLARAAAAEVRSCLKAGQAKVAGVVVNRVDTARAVYAELEGMPRALVTGRMRPFDRDDRLAEIAPRIRTGRSRSESDEPLVIVGTQSIEAGADFDFDVLITECASLDALRQRFGRVDRDGVLSQRGASVPSVVLAASEDVKADADDPVYGSALARTWGFLPDNGHDFASLPADDATLLAPRRQAPVLLPAHLDQWVQTSQPPDADPDPAYWLHGLENTSKDVTVVWRADLTEAALRLDNAELAVAIVGAVRPGSGEAMSVPIRAVRNWLIAESSDEEPVTDVEGAIGDDLPRGPVVMRPALIWRGDSSVIAAETRDLRPGVTVVVPASYGGVDVDSRNWDPASAEPVPDLGHRVEADQRRRAVLRLHEAVLAGLGLSDVPKPSDVDDDPYQTDDSVVGQWLADANGKLGGEGPVGRIVRVLHESNDRKVARVALGTGSMFVVSSKRPVPARQAPLAGGQAETEPETSSFTGIRTTLSDHHEHARDAAYWFAVRCGLTDEVAKDVALAAELHDLGKADPRFQDMLRDGALDDGELLAKSRIPAHDRAGRERARRDAGYPRGGGHELLSVALVQSSLELAAEAADWDLVLHLVASHHGACRPFAPVVIDRNPVAVTAPFREMRFEHSSSSGLARIDSGVADRFWRLVRSYGWFGLAWLECILRLADHRVSAGDRVAKEQ